jgi:hypothetical protein
VTRPRVEFILGQPAVHERGLESADHLLAVGVGCTEVAVASAFYGCRLISRP